MKSKEEMEKGIDRLREIQSRKSSHFERAKMCPKCGTVMKYMYGEVFSCPACGQKELSDFGKVREFLDINGPQPAIVISDNTGVDVSIINQFLKEGRVEIPDGSDVYIQCQSCGADIRYGRFCPDCILKMTKNLGSVMWMPEVGEKPTRRGEMSGRMHTLDREDDKDRKGKKNGKRR